MGKYVLEDCKFWLDQYDLSGDMNAMALNYSADMQEDTTFGSDGTHTFLGGLKSVTIGHEGVLNTGVGEVDEVLFNKVSSLGSIMTIGPTSGADGEVAYMLQTLISEYSPGASIGELLSFSVSGEANENGLIRGTIMSNSPSSSSGVGITRALGAVSTGKRVYATIHVISGSGSLDVIVVSDGDPAMGSPATRITFSNQSGPGSEFSSSSTVSIDDNWRIEYTVSGTFNFVVAVGIK